MRICKNPKCAKEVVGDSRKRYCTQRCKLDVKNEKEYAKKKLLRLSGGIDESVFGTLFDCKMSREWLMRPLRTA